MYEQNLPLTDKQIEACLKLGLLYQEQKQYEESFQALVTAIRQDKNYLSAYYQYAHPTVFAKMQLSQGVSLSYLKYQQIINEHLCLCLVAFGTVV